VTTIPDALVDGSAMPASRGFVDGDWFVEEDVGASRAAVRVMRVLHEETSAYQKISVYESAFFGKLLVLDDLMMLTERDEFVYHEMLVHLPLCTMPSPRSVLIIGGGDCGCLREALRHPGIERVVQCDIDERVTRVCEQHFPWVAPAIGDARAELVFKDGAEYIDNNVASFDLVIIDSTDPKGPAVNLFLRDFYQRAAGALRLGGVLACQTESPHWNPGMVAAIYGELRAVFRQVDAYLGWIPTYPSGAWSWAFASNARRWDEHFAEERAEKLEQVCQYYNRDIHRAAFALPGFVRRVVTGANPFAEWERRHREAMAEEDR